MDSFFVYRTLANRKVLTMRNLSRCSAAQKVAIQVGRSKDGAKAQD